MLVQSEGTQPLWYCEYITVKDDVTENPNKYEATVIKPVIQMYLNSFRFMINQLFDGSNPENRNLTRHLTVYPENTGKENNFFSKYQVFE